LKGGIGVRTKGRRRRSGVSDRKVNGEDWNKFSGKPRGGYPFFQAFFQGPGERDG